MLNRFPKIVSKLVENNSDDTFELELRFTAKEEIFNKIKSWFVSNKYEMKQEKSEDEIQKLGNKSIKKTILNGKTSWQEKETISYESLNGLKLSLSKETVINKPSEFSTELKRFKDRTTFTDGISNIDFTKVNEGAEIKYEIEVDLTFIGKLTWEQTNSFNKSCETVLFITQDVVNIFNRKLNSKKTYPTITDIAKAEFRNLHMKDCRNTGLMGGKIEYLVSIKANGYHCYLFSLNRWLWICQPFKNPVLFSDTKIDNQVILEGELMGDNFLAYDIIFTDLEVDIRTKLFSERLKTTKDFVESFKIVFKDSYPLGKSFESLKEAIGKAREFVVDNDGLIFTPNTSHMSLNPKVGRSLIDKPDICKLKDIITIDLKIEKGKVYLKDSEFKGSDDHPLKELNLKDAKDGEIWEFKLVGDVLTADKHRSDRTEPNSGYSGNINWKDMNRPFTVEDLLGKSIAMLSSHHNNIKSHLFSECQEGSVLIDLGAGKGGDIYKQKDIFNKIFAVEPDKEHFDEYRERLSKLKEKDKFTSFHGGVQDIIDKNFENIQKWYPGNGIPIYISCMLSLPMIYHHLRSLLRVLEQCQSMKNVGEIFFLFLTPKKDLTKELLRKHNGRFKAADENIIMEEAFIEKKSKIKGSEEEKIKREEAVHIKIKHYIKETSTAEDQIEKYVEMEKLLFLNIDYKSSRNDPIDNNPLIIISPDLAEYNNIFIYGVGKMSRYFKSYENLAEIFGQKDKIELNDLPYVLPRIAKNGVVLLDNTYQPHLAINFTKENYYIREQKTAIVKSKIVSGKSKSETIEKIKYNLLMTIGGDKKTM